ncbi:transporter substrate-binding domain-containing protein [Vibrio pectenicida]|uniref:Transporter substrate-binding domain-containing protein n=1 Tax=Vibrio pectenicida TaxID=62763 RepID=A0A7Y3ZYG0_9VIBR|nr:transporter substrate-binding domain-containing protein [Vibrio pectenicida]NOH71380.1 transporter substrate-binding domain-containing protein [Vibrio pectenicida]
MPDYLENIIKSFLLLFLLLFSSSVVVAKPLIITVSEYPPYHSKDLPGFGINAQIVSAAFESQKVAIEYQQMNTWKEAFDYAAGGKADAAALWEYNQAHKNDFLISDSVYKINAHFFYNNKREFSWRKVSDLKGYTISALIGGYYGDAFEAAEKSGEIKVIRVYDETENVKKLVDGSIDLAPLYITSFNYVLKTQGLADKRAEFSYHSKPLFTNSVHLLMPKSNPQSKYNMVLFNEGLKAIKANGALQSILNDHLNYR